MNLFKIILVMMFSFANAHTPPMECEVTPQIWDIENIPTSIAKTNNLRRNTGSPFFAEGEVILLEGYVMDSACVPISDAIVEIWQADFKGEIRYNEKNGFVGTGQTITDNMGYYNFSTIFPGKSKAPTHINVRVKHKDFPIFETKVFLKKEEDSIKFLRQFDKFSDQKVNLLFAKQKNYIKSDVSTKNIKYSFDITLEGKNKYKKY